MGCITTEISTLRIYSCFLDACRWIHVCNSIHACMHTHTYIQSQNTAFMVKECGQPTQVGAILILEGMSQVQLVVCEGSKLSHNLIPACKKEGLWEIFYLTAIRNLYPHTGKSGKMPVTLRFTSFENCQVPSEVSTWAASSQIQTTRKILGSCVKCGSYCLGQSPQSSVLQLMRKHGQTLQSVSPVLIQKAQIYSGVVAPAYYPTAGRQEDRD